MHAVYTTHTRYGNERHGTACTATHSDAALRTQITIHISARREVRHMRYTPTRQTRHSGNGASGSRGLTCRSVAPTRTAVRIPIGAARNGGGGSGGGNGGGGGGGGEGGAESGGRCGEATGRADTVAAAGRGRQAALHLGHHCVSEEGSRGRERSECLTPKGSSAERVREVMSTSRRCKIGRAHV